MLPDDFRDIRIRLGLSQAEMGRALGASRPTIAKWEAGVHRIPLSAAVLAAQWDAEATDQRRIRPARPSRSSSPQPGGESGHQEAPR